MFRTDGLGTGASKGFIWCVDPRAWSHSHAGFQMVVVVVVLHLHGHLW